ncbi:MAG TPA: queuosine precursor transporter [Candidatus Saccharimonadia bacterium]|nr:queuosine precursor transporter [Candidatus Saccharimonadia bacterium]
MKINRLDLVVSLYILCIVVSELMGAKIVPLGTIFGFHLNASVAILVVPLMFSAVDVMVEVYGRDRARSLVMCGVIVIALLMVYALAVTNLPPSTRFAAMEPSYDKVFGTSIRMAAASLVAFGLASLLDVMVFSKLRERMHKKALWFRNNISNVVSQFFDTAIFMTLAFYVPALGLGDNLSFLLGVGIPYWLLKCLMSVIETPLVYAGVAWLRGDKSKTA